MVCGFILFLWWIYYQAIFFSSLFFFNCLINNFKLFLISIDWDSAVRAGYPVIAGLAVESPANLDCIQKALNSAQLIGKLKL